MQMKNLWMAMLAGYLLLAGCTSYEKRLQECDSVGEFRDGYARCLKDGKYFFIDKNGKQVSKKYDELMEFENGYAAGRNLTEDKLTDILSKDGCKRVYSCPEIIGHVNKWGNLWVCFEEGLFLVGMPMGTYALLNLETGSFKAYQSKSSLDCVDEESGVAVLRRSNERENMGPGISYYEYVLYDGEGNELVPFGKYSYIGEFHSGLAIFSTTGYQRIASDEGRIMLPGKRIKSYEPPRLGYIDTRGNVVIPEKFVMARDFNEKGYAKAVLPRSSNDDWNHSALDRELTEKELIIDKNGNILTGRARSIGMASFIEDGKLTIGKDEKGICFVVNNKGETQDMERGVELLINDNYIAARTGKTYKMYEVKDGQMAYLCTIEGFGSPNEAVFRSDNTTDVGFKIVKLNDTSYNLLPITSGEFVEYEADGTFLRSGYSNRQNKYIGRFKEVD